MREGGSETRLRQGTFMITGEREVPDPAQSTWACQEVQVPEKVGSGLTAGIETGRRVVTSRRNRDGCGGL